MRGGRAPISVISWYLVGVEMPTGIKGFISAVAGSKDGTLGRLMMVGSNPKTIERGSSFGGLGIALITSSMGSIARVEASLTEANVLGVDGFSAAAAAVSLAHFHVLISSSMAMTGSWTLWSKSRVGAVFSKSWNWNGVGIGGGARAGISNGDDISGRPPGIVKLKGETILGTGGKTG
jgi:hypothetical protein